MHAERAATAAVPVAEEHAELLARFFRAVWDPAATPEAVVRGRAAAAAANPVAPGEAPPTFIVLARDRAVGYLTTIPFRLSCHGREHGAHWLKGLAVLPEYQNSAVGFLLLRRAIRELPLSLAMVVQPGAVKLFRMLGHTDVGVVPNYVRVLEPTRVLRRLDMDALGVARPGSWKRSALRVARAPGLAPVLGNAARLLLRAGVLAAGRPPALDVHAAAAPDRAGLDALWRSVRNQLPAAAVRDGAAVLPAQGSEGGGGMRVLGAYQRSALVAYATVRAPRAQGDPRLNGIRVASVSDLLFRPDAPAAGLAVLAAAEETGREFGADALFCSASHPVLGRLLRRRGYVGMGGNMHLLARDATLRAALPAPLSDWWVTRSDSAADETF